MTDMAKSRGRREAPGEPVSKGLRRRFSGRGELLVTGALIFGLSSVLLCRQEIVTQPGAASSLRVRSFSPVAPDGAARPMVLCSLNAVAAVPPRDVWIVGNRGLVLHSTDEGASWSKVPLETSRPPRELQKAADSWLTLVPVAHAAAPAPQRTERVEQDVFVPPGRNARTSDPACLDDKAEDPSARCADVVVQIPQGARVRSVTGYAAEVSGDFLPCLPDCRIGWSKFVDKPQFEDTRLVWRFKNWSHDRSRRARVVVEFEVAPDPAATAPGSTPVTTVQAPAPDRSPPPTPPSQFVASEDLVGVHFASTPVAQRGWIVSRSGHVVTTIDGGSSWQAADRLPPEWTGRDFNGADERDAALARVVGGHFAQASLWLAGDDGRIRRQGSTAKEDLVISTDGKPLYGIFFRDRDQGWAVGSEGRIFSFPAGAQLATPQASPTTADLNAVAFMPDGQRGWAVGAKGTILATANGGAAWRAVSVPGDSGPRPWSPRVPYWYVGTTLLAFGLLLLATQVKPPPPWEDESIADAPGSDRPVESLREDVLNFQAVARGLSRFLRNEKTTPPLTIAVTGAWGTGKTSLMNLLRADLHAFGFRSVWFNAWHHQKEEHLLAALLQTVRLQAVPPIWSPAGWEFRVRLVAIRGWRHWVVVGLVLGVFAFLAGYESRQHMLAELAAVDAAELAETFSRIPAALAAIPSDSWRGWFLASGLSVVLTGIKLLKPFGVSPASLLASVSGSGRLSALEAQTSFRHQFAAEFRDVTRALGPRTMPIFIDDLDRCRPQQVVDVLEAVSFLVSSGDCFVVLGMARDRVERCVGLSFKDLADEGGGSGAGAREARELFARQYLDKLINIEVPIQEPTVGQSKDLLVKEVVPTPQSPWRTVLGLWPVIPLIAIVGLSFWSGQHTPGLTQQRERETTPAASAPKVGPGEHAVVPNAPVQAASIQRRDLRTRPPVGGTDERPEVLTSPPRPWFLSYLMMWPLGLAVGLVATWALTRRHDLVVRDSAEFRRALGIWHPVVFSHRPTPRALKRFMNRLRYLAMRQRTYPPAPPMWRQWLAHLPGVAAVPSPEWAANQIPESALVALATIDEFEPKLVRQPITDHGSLPSEVARTLAEHETVFLPGSVDGCRAAYLAMSGRVQVN